MISHQITLVDVVNVTGMNRHRLRNLLKEIPEFQSREAHLRVANIYTEQDLTVLSICVLLEERYGLRREVICELERSIRKALSGPKNLANGAYLHLLPFQTSAHYVEKLKVPSEGIYLPLDDVLHRIDAYLQVGRQKPLQYPIVVVQEVKEPAVSRPQRKGIANE